MNDYVNKVLDIESNANNCLYFVKLILSSNKNKP